MRISRKHDLLKLVFGAEEMFVLNRILTVLRQNYSKKPEELDPKSAATWYSTRGCKSAKMSAEETKDWVDQLHMIRGERLGRLETWMEQLKKPSRSKENPTYQLKLSVKDDGAEFVATLNDHRMLMAAQHDIGQEEMDALWPKGMKELPLNQQMALMDIAFLAWIIETVLHLMALPEEPPPETPKGG